MESALSEIIRQRRSTRSFSQTMPDKSLIEQIIASAVYAPYGGATGIPLDHLRKIYIFRRGTPAMNNFKTILIKQIARNSRKLNRAVKLLPFLKKKFGAFATRLNNISENGIPALEQAAYVIVIAEKKGFPPVEKQSIAHAMQNMWLIATDQGIGFQMLSAVGTLDANKDFMSLLNLEKGRYAVDGCVLGLPIKEPTAREPKNTEHFAHWM